MRYCMNVHVHACLVGIVSCPLDFFCRRKLPRLRVIIILREPKHGKNTLFHNNDAEDPTIFRQFNFLQRRTIGKSLSSSLEDDSYFCINMLMMMSQFGGNCGVQRIKSSKGIYDLMRWQTTITRRRRRRFLVSVLYLAWPTHNTAIFNCQGANYR